MAKRDYSLPRSGRSIWRVRSQSQWGQIWSIRKIPREEAAVKTFGALKEQYGD
jgi:hypothetical protein